VVDHGVPTLIGTDLGKITPAASRLLNWEVIAVDQDPLGAQGHPRRDAHGIHVIGCSRTAVAPCSCSMKPTARGTSM
jgi:hypothetical protein